MKITMYELLGMIKDGKAPKKFIYDNQLFILDEEDNVYRSHLGNRFGAMYQLDIKLNDEIEIIEEESRNIEVCGTWFTKSEYDKLAQSEEEKKIPEKINISNFPRHNNSLKKTAIKVNEIIDYLKSKGE